MIPQRMFIRHYNVLVVQAAASPNFYSRFSNIPTLHHFLRGAGPLGRRPIGAKPVNCYYPGLLLQVKKKTDPIQKTWSSGPGYFAIGKSKIKL
jgi:hypothetical protein